MKAMPLSASRIAAIFFNAPNRVCVTGLLVLIEGVDIKTIPYLRCKRKEFNTTEIELNAIAAEAIIGFSLPIAATGMAIVL